jgi:hypothetical protein
MRKVICLLALLFLNITAAPNSFSQEASELSVFRFEQLDEKVVRVQLGEDDEEDYGEQLVTTVVDEVSGESSVVKRG